MSDEMPELLMPPHSEDCDWASSNDPCTCGLDDFIATRVEQWRAKHPLTLTDFILARIAEDEVVAQRAGRSVTTRRPQMSANTASGQIQVPPSRILAECEAKRRIVEAFSNEGPWRAHRAAERSQEVWVLTALAWPYADHPDFREEWLP